MSPPQLESDQAALIEHEDEAPIASSQHGSQHDDGAPAVNVPEEQDWLTLRRRCELCKQRKVSLEHCLVQSILHALKDHVLSIPLSTTT